MKPAGFGLVLLANLLVFGGLGWFLDSRFGTSPLFLIILGLYAILGSIYLLVKKSRD
jgi:F0F1-type ATP synthase assembly protein I